MPLPHALFEEDWPEDFRYFQMGFVVDDIPASAAKWSEVFGVGPFFVSDPVEAPWLFRGQPGSVTIQIATSWAGPVQIELIKQWCDRPSMFREDYWGRSTGFHQICTVTPDYDGKKAHYERAGYELVAEIGGPLRVGYFDTTAPFGFFTEVVEDTPGFLAERAELARICAEWDGSEALRPVRPGVGREAPGPPT
jgi:Glyoxalase/Bleomycin resistance protein/Dioxygenase superfamily